MAERPKTATDALKQFQETGQFWDPMDKAMRGTTQTESPEQTLAHIQGRYRSTEAQAAPPPSAAPPPAAPRPVVDQAALTQADFARDNAAMASLKATPPPPPAAAAAAPSAAPSVPTAPEPTKTPEPAMASLMAQPEPPVDGGMDVAQSGPAGLRQNLGMRNPPQYNYALASLGRGVY